MSTRSARDDLAAFAASGATLWTWPREFGVTDTSDYRPASVLALFGVLDGVPAENAASAVPRDLDVLLLARAATLRSHAGQVAFPGGRQDAGDEGPVAAALREAREETGLDTDGVEVLGTLAPLPLPFSAHLVTPVVGWWSRQSPVGVVDAAESAHVFRAPVADLLDPVNRYGVAPPSRPARRTPGFLVTVAGVEHLVWGFTAMILDALFESLGWVEPWDRSRTITLE